MPGWDDDFQVDGQDWGSPFQTTTQTQEGVTIMSNAISGLGSTLEREDDASSGVYDAIAEVNSIGGPGMTRDFIDVTSLDSSGGYREFISGFRDGGTLTFEMNFTIANYGQMKVDFDSDDSINYQLVLGDATATTLNFTAFVTDLPLNIVPDDKVTCSVTLKITGEVSLTS